MLRIRLFRAGKRNQPFFKIVVIDKKAPPRGGKPLEILGFYNPLTKERGLKKERIQYWLSVGAQPSDTVWNLLIREGILKGKKIALHKKKKKKEKEEVKEATQKEKAVEEKTETTKKELKTEKVEELEKQQKSEEK